MAPAVEFNEFRAASIIERYAGIAGAMLPLLHELQDEFGCVPAEAVPLVAQALNLSRAEVHGVVTFYHDYRRLPPGRHELKLCQAEACQSNGCRDLARHAQDRLGIEFGQTTPDRRMSLSAVYCLGLCPVGPNAMLDGKLIARVDRAKLDRLLGALA